MSNFDWPPRRTPSDGAKRHIFRRNQDREKSATEGQTIQTLDELDRNCRKNLKKESDFTFNFLDPNIDTTYWGPVKNKK